MQEEKKGLWNNCVAGTKKAFTFCVNGMRQIVDKTRRFTNFKQHKKELYASWDEEAEKGNQEACYKLMMLYFDETEEYYPLAFKWTQRIACTVPDCAAMLQLAKMYDDGHGTACNKDQALTWYEHCLSLHIIRGKNSPLSVDAANFVQQRIQALRAQKSAN